MLGAQPGEDGLVVVARLQKALGLWAAVEASGAIEFGRHDELFQGTDGGGRGDDGVQLVGEELAARHRYMAAELQFDADLVGVGHVPQPFDVALRLALTHRLDAGVPASAHAVDALDQLREREDVCGFEMAGQRGVQPGGDRVAGLRGLGDQGFEPAQCFKLARDQVGAPAQALCGTTILSFKGGDLDGLALVFEAMRFGEGFEAREFEGCSKCGVGDAGGIDAHQARGAEPVLAFRGGSELVADPGDGGAHGALVGGLAFDAEVALPAFSGIEALHHRAHEGEVADVQLALAGRATALRSDCLIRRSTSEHFT